MTSPRLADLDPWVESVGHMIQINAGGYTCDRCGKHSGRPGAFERVADKCPICHCRIDSINGCSCSPPWVWDYRVRVCPRGEPTFEAVLTAPTSCSALIRALELALGGRSAIPDFSATVERLDIRPRVEQG